jgi:5'-3' exonuclease
MGVRLLNTLIKENYNNLSQISFEDLRNKKIAIDTNIYIYKYSNTNNLIESFYKLCNIFIKYEIKPIFVFDGESPYEKNEELLIRKENKKKAKDKYNKLTEEIKHMTDINSIEQALYKLKSLKSQFLKITRTQVAEVKSLIDAFGLTTIVADDEGEKLCSYFMINNIVDGIITEDSDVFVYGCKKIYRNISFVKETIVEYDYNHILKQLNLTKEELTYLCIMSLNDYNHTGNNIIQNYNYWMLYKENNKNENDSLIMSYLLDNIGIDKVGIENINNIKTIYSFYNCNNMKKYYNINIYNKKINFANIKAIMQQYNFIFI